MRSDPIIGRCGLFVWRWKRPEVEHAPAVTRATLRSMEMIERLAGTDFHERWLVRENGELRVACVMSGWDPSRREQTIRVTQRWIGIAHPRMSSVL